MRDPKTPDEVHERLRVRTTVREKVDEAIRRVQEREACSGCGVVPCICDLAHEYDGSTDAEFLEAATGTVGGGLVLNEAGFPF